MKEVSKRKMILGKEYLICHRKYGNFKAVLFVENDISIWSVLLLTKDHVTSKGIISCGECLTVRNDWFKVYEIEGE